MDPVGDTLATGAAFVHLCWEQRSPNPADDVTPALLASCRAAGLGVVLWHEERPAVIVALRQQSQDRVELVAFGSRGGYYRFAASVHYEVEDEHPRHPYIDECGLCGRTGSYRDAADLFSGVHEPLGLELLLEGTVRGQRVLRPDGRPVTGLAALGQHHAFEVHRFAPSRPDQNVVELAWVAIAPRG